MSYDVFISYSHKDNLPVGFDDPPKRWVTIFHERLKVILTQALNREAKVWRDERIQGESISDAICEALADSRVILPLLSEGFFDSGWCPYEIQLFRDFVCDQGDEKNEFLRIQPALKIPPKPGSVSGFYSDKKAIEFFHRDEGSDQIHQWDPSIEEHAALFTQAIYALCDNISKAISPGDQKTPSRCSVYLGASDRSELIARTQRELSKLGYAITGQFSPLPANLGAFKEKAASALGESALVVLLPGRRPLEFGDFPVELTEWELIRERLEAGECRCIAWVDDERRPVHEEQEQWINQLGGLPGVELLRCSFQKFLSNLPSMLLRAEEKVQIQKPSDRPLLLVDWHDCDRLHPLIADLKTVLGGFADSVEVVQPGSDAADWREKWNKTAPRARGAVLFSARSNASWIRANYEALVRKQPGLREKVICVLGPDGAEDKLELLNTPEMLHVIAEEGEALRAQISAILERGTV